MSSLNQLLHDTAVEIVESDVELKRSELEQWSKNEQEKKNRAVSGIIRNDQGQLLLMRHSGDGSEDGWRLPGSEVGRIMEFESRLREELNELLGARVTSVTPIRIHKHTGRHGSAETSLFYMLCDVDLEQLPEKAQTQPPNGDGYEFKWFSESPEEVVNSEVMPRLFTDIQ